VQHFFPSPEFDSARWFDAAVRKHQAECNAKGFTCWGQSVAMLFCQLG